MTVIYCATCWMQWREGWIVAEAVTVINGMAVCANHASLKKPETDPPLAEASE